MSCTLYSRTKVVKCIRISSVVLSKITACVLERKAECSIVLIGEKWTLSCYSAFVEGLDHSKLVRIPGSTSSRREHRFVGCHEATRTRMRMKARMKNMVIKSECVYGKVKIR